MGMSITKEAARKLSNDELLGIHGLEVFSRQDEMLLDLLQRRNGIKVNVFNTIHREKGCKSVPIFTHAEETGFQDYDTMTNYWMNMYKRWCRNHGTSSTGFGEFKVLEETSLLDYEMARFNFVNFVSIHNPTERNITSAWERYSIVIKEWEKGIGVIHPPVEDRNIHGDHAEPQEILKLLYGEDTDPDLVLRAQGMFNLLILGTDKEGGEFIKHLSSEKKSKAKKFCKSMSVVDWTTPAIRQLESIVLIDHANVLD